MRSPRAEELFIPAAGTLDIDHILPDKGYEHWDLNGETVTAQEASQASRASFFGEESAPRQAVMGARAIESDDGQLDAGTLRKSTGRRRTVNSESSGSHSLRNPTFI